MDAAYELSKLSRFLDFIHMMCYDYHGTWDGVVGANAPLTGLSEEDVLSIVSSLLFYNFYKSFNTRSYHTLPLLSASYCKYSFFPWLVSLLQTSLKERHNLLSLAFLILASC
ncbi:hypothetical protein JYU34_001135 [Plutella xylostella]|uniref:GH18 domain-containing protein n=1 Tax=Plutella xylostella TaxID=51655 RepID=A0ABQ7R630_PLUXY|nr:hypothetical protein JYU34_001135 [Plutella xylostella]